MFDVPPVEEQTISWSGEVPLDEREWSVGAIVGPSGSGKSTVARHLFGDAIVESHEWGDGAVIDSFPPSLALPELASLCQAVGFNTIPAWLRPHHVLSNGEKFRADLARTLCAGHEIAVVDEFTSVVDRQVAKIGSHAVQKYVRRNGGKFVAVTCHYDILGWLQPDWILEPATMTFSWREVRRRPAIECDIRRVDYSLWRLFAPYHYMTADLSRAAQCYALFIADRPAAFAAVLYRPHQTARNIYGVSRLVTLPDYQGLGLAFALVDTLGAAVSSLGGFLHTYPAHPALIRAFDRSTAWQLRQKPGLSSGNRASRTTGRMGGRPNAVFRYVGPADPDPDGARQLLGMASLSRRT